MKKENLTQFEMSVVEPLIELLKTKRNPVKGDVLCAQFNFKNNFPRELDCITLRRVINHIRCESIAPICAHSNGYFITENQEQIEEQIKSLEERAFAILAASNGLKNFIL